MKQLTKESSEVRRRFAILLAAVGLFFGMGTVIAPQAQAFPGYTTYTQSIPVYGKVNPGWVTGPVKFSITWETSGTLVRPRGWSFTFTNPVTTSRAGLTNKYYNLTNIPLEMHIVCSGVPINTPPVTMTYISTITNGTVSGDLYNSNGGTKTFRSKNCWNGYVMRYTTNGFTSASYYAVVRP